MSANLNIAPPSIEFKDELGLKDYHSNSEQVDIAKVFHCDGLLLCITKDTRLVVWNPCLGEARWIQPKTAYKSLSRFALGYQNNKSCRSYKILRYWHNFKQDDRVVECEIYGFSSDSWRVLDDIDPSCVILGYGGMSLKGNTYWLACEKTDDFLLCFDFTTERFRRLCLPLSQNRSSKALSVVKEERLLMLQQSSDTSKMEIWVTNKFDNEAALLWSKSFTVDSHTYVYASLLVDEEKKAALCCDLSVDIENNKVYTTGEDIEYYSEIPFMESTTESLRWIDNIFEQSTNKSTWSPFIFNYVPSLVQIQQGRGKRKERD